MDYAARADLTALIFEARMIYRLHFIPHESLGNLAKLDSPPFFFD